MVVDRTLYDVLGVEPNATQETIAKVKTRQEYFLIKDLEEIFDLKLNKYILIVNIDQAVKTKSLEHHPDRGGSVEMVRIYFKCKRMYCIIF